MANIQEYGGGTGAVYSIKSKCQYLKTRASFIFSNPKSNPEGCSLYIFSKNMKISMILCKVRDSDIAALPPMNIQNQLHASKQTHTVGSEINTKYKCQNHGSDIIATGFFHLQMRISFPFLRAKDLYTSLLIMRTRSFFTLLYIGGTYARLVYCSRFQVERTSTWNPNTPHTYGKARTETSPRIASGRQHGGHKITT